MAGGEHTSRASKPAPTRYGSESNPIWATPENTDTPEASAVRLSGELLAEPSKLPPASSRQSGKGVLIHDMARRGQDLTQIASQLRRSRGDIDPALWALVGSRPVGQILEELNAGRPA